MATIASERGRPCVLVVEDEPDFADLLVEFLDSHGFDSARARDGVDALSFLYARTPAFVLLDMMMPHMGGLDVIDQMRNDSRLADIPIVAMSAADGLLARASDLGVHTVLAKPLDLDALARVLEAHRARSGSD